MTILVADDDADIILALSDQLRKQGHVVESASDGRAASEAVLRRPPDLVFLDIEMPELSGIDVLSEIRSRHATLPVIIMTAHGTIGLAVDAMKRGATDFITKPFDYAQLETVMAQAVERQRLEGEVGRLLGEISHDVKNLMMPVVCGSDLIESEMADLLKLLPDMEAAKAAASRQLCVEVIDMLRRAAQRIQDRTKDIADYVKVARTPVQFAPCSLRDIVDGVLRMLHLPAETRGVTLTARGLEQLPPIMADANRLHAVFYNLVHNAIPEVPAGGPVTVTGSLPARGEAVVVSITDTGRGMPPAIREHLFDAGTMSRKPGGTGLGLRIIHDAVKAHRGRISVDSVEGRGTSFQIELPLTQLS